MKVVEGMSRLRNCIHVVESLTLGIAIFLIVEACAVTGECLISEGEISSYQRLIVRPENSGDFYRVVGIYRGGFETSVVTLFLDEDLSLLNLDYSGSMAYCVRVRDSCESVFYEGLSGNVEASFDYPFYGKVDLLVRFEGESSDLDCRSGRLTVLRIHEMH